MTPTEETIEARAARLARELIIVDTHIDAPYRLEDRMQDLGVAAEGVDFDYPRARQGGLDVPFMSIYVPSSFQRTGGGRAKADELIDMVEAMATRHPDKFTVVSSVDDARASFRDGRVGLALGIENGVAIEGELAALRHFHERGVRYMTLTHSENNRICDSSYADERQWNGLSPFGEQVVAEMNRLGIMIDVSHISDAAFDRVMELSRAPVIASHSSCRHFTPDWERNLDDDRIRRLGDNGGVLHVNFGSVFLTHAARQQSSEYWERRREYQERTGLESDHADLQAWSEQYWVDRPRAFADVTDVADHIDRVVELAGIDHVGIGSDYDGVGDTLPTGLKDVSGYPNLIAELLRRGYDESEIGKICSGNLLRVWSEVERIAREAAH